MVMVVMIAGAVGADGDVVACIEVTCGEQTMAVAAVHH